MPSLLLKVLNRLGYEAHEDDVNAENGQELNDQKTEDSHQENRGEIDLAAAKPKELVPVEPVSSYAGWLNPEGQFFPLSGDAYTHSAAARIQHGSSYASLLADNWVRVDEARVEMQNAANITDPQWTELENILASRGEFIFSSGKLDIPIEFSDLSEAGVGLKEFYSDWTRLSKTTAKKIAMIAADLLRKANDPVKKTVDVNGIKIKIEWPMGSTRTYEGGKYTTEMMADYGYLPKSTGDDGEEIDVYVGMNHDSKKVFVVQQMKKGTQEPDEEKYMLGYNTANEAKQSYLDHMPSGFFGGLTEMSWDQFSKMVKHEQNKESSQEPKFKEGQKVKVTFGPDSFVGKVTKVYSGETGNSYVVQKEKYPDSHQFQFNEVYLEALSDQTKTADDQVKKVIDMHGIQFDIEWPKGSVREQTDSVMIGDYGFVPALVDKDGDSMDVLIGPDHNSEHVFKVEQLDKEGEKRQDKYVLGTHSEKEASDLYDRHFADKRRGETTEMSWSQFVSIIQKGQNKEAAFITKVASQLMTATSKIDLPITHNSSCRYASAHGLAGKLIVLEGLDGSGKSSNIQMLKQALELEGHDVVLTSWNSSTLVSDLVKEAKKNKLLTPVSFSLLHATDLAERMRDTIIPALKKGSIVLADRYFPTAFARDSVRGMDYNWLRNVYAFAIKPDAIVYLDLPVKEAVDRVLARKASGGESNNRAETSDEVVSMSEDYQVQDFRVGNPKYYEAGLDLNLSKDPVDNFHRFQEKVAAKYLAMSEEFGFKKVQANQDKVAVHKAIMAFVLPVVAVNLKKEATVIERTIDGVKQRLTVQPVYGVESETVDSYNVYDEAGVKMLTIPNPTGALLSAVELDSAVYDGLGKLKGQASLNVTGEKCQSCGKEFEPKVIEDTELVDAPYRERGVTVTKYCPKCIKEFMDSLKPKPKASVEVRPMSAPKEKTFVCGRYDMVANKFEVKIGSGEWQAADSVEGAKALVARVGSYDAASTFVNNLMERVGGTHEAVMEKLAGPAKELKCPECGEPVWDTAFANKLNKCWNCGVAFDNESADGEEVEAALSFNFTDDQISMMASTLMSSGWDKETALYEVRQLMTVGLDEWMSGKDRDMVMDMKEALEKMQSRTTAGIEKEEARPAPTPLSLFTVETAPDVVDRLKSEIQAPVIGGYPSTLGGDENVAIMLTISADPRESWSNGILENSRYGKFDISNNGVVENFSGSFPKFRKRTVRDVDQLIQLFNDFLASLPPSEEPVKQASEPAATIYEESGSVGDGKPGSLKTPTMPHIEAAKRIDDVHSYIGNGKFYCKGQNTAFDAKEAIQKDEQGHPVCKCPFDQALLPMREVLDAEYKKEGSYYSTSPEEWHKTQHDDQYKELPLKDCPQCQEERKNPYWGVKGSTRKAWDIGEDGSVDEGEEPLEKVDGPTNEPDEEDIMIQDVGTLGAGTAAFQNGKQIAKFNGDDWDDFYEQIASWMKAHSFFPNVWYITDHGNVDLDEGWISYTKSHSV